MPNNFKKNIQILFIIASCSIFLDKIFAQPENTKILVLTERGGHHEGFVVAALDWLKTYSIKKNLDINIINNTDKINDDFLA